MTNNQLLRNYEYLREEYNTIIKNLSDKDIRGSLGIEIVNKGQKSDPITYHIKLENYGGTIVAIPFYDKNGQIIPMIKIAIHKDLEERIKMLFKDIIEKGK